MNWTAELTEDELKKIKARIPGHFSKGARHGLSFVLTRSYRSTLPREQQATFDLALMKQRVLNANLKSLPHQEDAFERAARRIHEAIESAILAADDATGHHAQDGLLWIETKAAELSKKLFTS